MNLAELFGLNGLKVPFQPVDKWEAIESLVQHLSGAGILPEEQVETALDLVLQRERSMSTGMEKGIAIPHAAIPGLEGLAACLGVTPQGEGIAFESMDGAPTELVVLLLIPKDKKLLHIRTLADVARILGNQDVRDRLTQSADAEAAFQVLSES